MCNCNKNRERWVVVLKSGMKIYKSSESQAKAFAEKHPGDDGKPAPYKKV